MSRSGPAALVFVLLLVVSCDDPVELNNAGFGVSNLSGFTVDAAGNWWGDLARPDGPEGDGVSGEVVVEPVRTEPVQR